MRASLQLDVVIPTHNRGELVERAVRSVLAADRAPGIEAHVTVVCNACRDDTATRLESVQREWPGRVTIAAERRLGKARALNAGIARTRGDLVGMIDDDEEVDARWVARIGEAFASDPELEFIGGPYVPCWPSPPPPWIPENYMAVVGGADGGSTARAYGPHFPGILKGGNAVIRRRTLERVGPYAEYLGPGASARLFSCEDDEMYLRLLEHGARGWYFPDLIVYHHVLPSRLTPEYFRRWCFWRGVSRGLMDRRHPLPVKYLGGVPRFLYAPALRGFLRIAGARVGRGTRTGFADELAVWDLAGFLYGRHVYPLARFSPVKSRRGIGTSERSAEDTDEPEVQLTT